MDDVGHPPLLHADETFQIRGAVFEVHTTLGPGFFEAVYQEALSIELQARRIPFRAQQPLTLSYKGHPLRQAYAADFICFDKVVVELKVARDFAPEHRARVLERPSTQQ